MKIALVSQEYPPETARGGISSQTFVKATGLAAMGHEVFVISRSLTAERHEKMVDNICIIRIPGMEDQIPEMTEIIQWVTHSIVVAREIDSLHRRTGLDIIDFPEWAAEGYIYLLNRTSWNTVPVVIQLHGPLVMFAHTMNWPELNSSFYKAGIHMEATCIQLADAVYSSSECSAGWIRSYYHPAKNNIPVIHLGVDTALFFPKKLPKKGGPVIIFTGKIVKNKGVEELVHAACNLVNEFPGLRLKLIGHGEAGIIAKLSSWAIEQNARDLLEFPGFMSKEALVDEISSANVFAAASYYEGGPGFVYLEAMACGLPVIGCSGSGAEEIIIPGETGLLVPPGNVTALEDALRKILGNKKEAEAMGVNARNFVMKNADSKNCLKKLEAFYRSVLEYGSVEKEAKEYE